MILNKDMNRVFWEEQAVNDFYQSLEKTGGVCLFPIGCIEKHGNHLPLGTDVYTSREICARATKQEEAMIFPSWPLGIVAEVIRHIKNDDMIPDLFAEFYSQHENPQI